MDLNNSAPKIVACVSHLTAPTRSDREECKPVLHIGYTLVLKQHRMVMNVRLLPRKSGPRPCNATLNQVTLEDPY